MGRRPPKGDAGYRSNEAVSEWQMMAIANRIPGIEGLAAAQERARYYTAYHSL